MAKYFQKEVKKLKKMILNLGASVEENVLNSVKAFDSGDAHLAKKIIAKEIDINRREIQIEEECLKIMALYQPVAFDLRYLVAVLKINSDLERIDDLVVNFADRTLDLPQPLPVEVPFNISEMANDVKKMLKKSLDALVNLSAGTAWQVLALDPAVDLIYKEAHEKVKQAIQEQPNYVNEYISFLSVARYLERIGDLASNIAEDVIYLIEGEIVRHMPLSEALSKIDEQ
ncbi:MAG: phosphate transport system protein [bacterium]|jgi:phosphate transport system protein